MFLLQAASTCCRLTALLPLLLLLRARLLCFIKGHTPDDLAVFVFARLIPGWWRLQTILLLVHPKLTIIILLQ